MKDISGRLGRNGIAGTMNVCDRLSAERKRQTAEGLVDALD